MFFTELRMSERFHPLESSRRVLLALLSCCEPSHLRSVMSLPTCIGALLWLHVSCCCFSDTFSDAPLITALTLIPFGEFNRWFYVGQFPRLRWSWVVSRISVQVLLSSLISVSVTTVSGVQVFETLVLQTLVFVAFLVGLSRFFKAMLEFHGSSSLSVGFDACNDCLRKSSVFMSSAFIVFKHEKVCSSVGMSNLQVFGIYYQMLIEV